MKREEEEKEEGDVDLWGNIPGVADTTFEQAQTATDRLIGLSVQFYTSTKLQLVKAGEKNAEGISMYLTGVFLQNVIVSPNKSR